MKKPVIKKEQVESLYDARFLKLYDLHYKEGKHYFDATRRSKEDIVAVKTDEEFMRMLPDAVTIGVAVRLPGGSEKLLLQYEYRYPTGQFLLSPVAGLIDPEDRAEYERLTEKGESATEEMLKAAYEKALKTAAAREIFEETGIKVGAKDKLNVINPCAFSSPGMTDESNAFLFAEIELENTDCLNNDGAVGSELFGGFELIDREQAAELYKTGRDKNGNFFSLATWAVLGYFLK